MSYYPPRPCMCGRPVIDAGGRVLLLETCPACHAVAFMGLTPDCLQLLLPLSASAADPDPDYHASEQQDREERSDSSDCPF
jgi:hypothetical protein